MPRLGLPEHANLRSGIFMMLAMASFVSNDTLVKLVGPSLPVGEIVFVRGIFSVSLIAGLCVFQGLIGHLRLMASGKVVARALLDCGATLLFITALMHMALANLTAVMQAVPLAVAGLSALFLGERFGWRRAAAILVGFAGVMLIVKPNPMSFSAYDGLAFLIVIAVAIRDLVTRRIATAIPSLVVALANASFVTAGGLVLALVQGFVMPAPWQVGTLALAAVFLSSGYMFMVATLRLGELTATAPFRYSIMLFAIISGATVFGEYPDAWAAAGMCLVIGAGFYAAHREARLRNSARTPPP
jgi:drug/metabolite transporter (DMT)-like permease